MASGSNHLIAAYYSFIDPKKMKGWVDLLVALQRTVYPYKWLQVSCRSSAGQGKTDVPPLSYANQPKSIHYPKDNMVYNWKLLLYILIAAKVLSVKTVFYAVYQNSHRKILFEYYKPQPNK